MCKTSEEREQGMQNDMLEEGSCCAFIFEGRVQPRFWGKNTIQDLYVSLIDGDEVVDCRKIDSFDLEPVIMAGFGDKAIETLDRIEIGSKVVFTGKHVAVF